MPVRGLNQMKDSNCGTAIAVLSRALATGSSGYECLERTRGERKPGSQWRVAKLETQQVETKRSGPQELLGFPTAPSQRRPPRFSWRKRSGGLGRLRLGPAQLFLVAVVLATEAKVVETTRLPPTNPGYPQIPGLNGNPY